ncbi:MAG: RNA-binding protein [Chloroflexota bacterium]|jgi:cold-inducible RNA-binding protein
MKKLYVGNLPFDTDESKVRELFSEYGEVQSVDMINDRETGRFRGFCFVGMEDNDADAAVEALNNYSFNGRPLKVNEARPREERSGGGNYGGNRGGGGYGGGRPDSRKGYGNSQSRGDRDRW